MPDLTPWMLVFTRVGAFISVFPMFAAANVPRRIRVGIAAMLAFLLLPMIPPMKLGELSSWRLTQLMFMETSVGLLLGFVCRFIFYTLEIAGGIMATEMGLQMASEMNPLSSQNNPAPSTMLFWMGMMLMFTTDTHHLIIAALQRTYVLLPPGAAHPSRALLDDIIRRSGSMFALMIQIATPVLAIGFVVSMVFSLLSRAVPSMNVFSESMPVRTLAGLAVFGLSFNLMAQHIAAAVRRLPEDFLKVAQLLSGQ